MIRLGLRLTLNGGREAAVRLLITVAAVAIGVGLLLVALAGRTAIDRQNARTAWLDTAPSGAGPPVRSAAPAPADPLWWVFTADHFGGRTIDRVDLAATGLGSPVPPGLRQLPGPGQFYASPALDRLLHTRPAAELGARFPGHEIGLIGAPGLPAPNSLIAVVGHTPGELQPNPGASEITAINTDPTLGGPAGGFHSDRLATILAVGALALVLPVLIFIATAARLATARREQRFAAMRLVGATSRQVAIISIVEAGIAALGGVAAGFGVFFAVRPALTGVAFTGQPFAPGDLRVSLADIVIVALGVPIAAVVSARIAMRRVSISPLGVTRRVTPPRPRAYRLVVLVAGIGELLWFVAVGHPKTTGGQVWAYFSGCGLIMVGLIVAGPWLTMTGSRVLARRARRPAALLAGRRLADDPRGAFRTVSGLIVALFATSVSVGVITTILSTSGTTGIPGGRSGAARATLIQQFGGYDAPHISVQSAQPDPSTTLPAGLAGRLRSDPGVRGVTVVRRDPALSTDIEVSVLSCAELATTPVLGRCAPGAAVARIDGQLDLNPDDVSNRNALADRVWPGAPLTVGQLDALPLRVLVVQTDGTTAAVETARTALESTFPLNPPSTMSELNDNARRTIIELQQMTDVVIVVSLVIAGCSLAVSITGGVNDRKRPFSLLRLSGVPTGVLRRVVALEAAVPLLVVSVVSAGMGFLAAGLFLQSQLGDALRAPGASYYLLVLGGIAGSLAVIGATLPLIERITGPEVARNE